ncbi:MAG: tyrosine-protein phosphatase [Thermoleophilaceae bacterium]
MIDLHTHILPGLDDGPATIEESLDLARAFVEAGTTTVVATPHVREDYRVDAARIGRAVAELHAALAVEEVALEVVAGGEVAVTKVLDLDEAELRAVALGEGPYVLVESPYTYTGELLERALFDVQLKRLRPLLAHPERSPCFLGDLPRLAALVERGVLCSITAGSMAGRFGGTVRAFTLRLFEAGLVHAVASDAHGLGGRPPGLLVGFERAEPDLPGVLDQAAWFTREAPEAILAGRDLPPAPEPPRRRHGGLRRLSGPVRSGLGRRRGR